MICSKHTNAQRGKTTSIQRYWSHFVSLCFVLVRFGSFFVSVRSVSLWFACLRRGISFRVVFVSRFVSLRFASFRFVSLHYVTLRYVTLRYVTLRYVTLRYVMLCFVSFRSVSFRFVVFRFVSFRLHMGSGLHHIVLVRTNSARYLRVDKAIRVMRNHKLLAGVFSNDDVTIKATLLIVKVRGRHP